MLFAAASADAAELRWVPADNPVAVEAIGVPAAELAAKLKQDAADREWVKYLAVYAAPAPMMHPPAMVGTWSVPAPDRLRFKPRFPWARGVTYRAEFRAPGAEALVSFFSLPERVSAPTRVAQAYPSAAVLPENQLKFYVHFSAPMGRGRAYQHIHVRDAKGAVIDLSFLELEEELWDKTMTRLTLLIDPGRIKRGVKPLVDIGPVFEAGKAYSLTVAETFPDADGRPLGAAFEKKFRIGPADRTPIDHTKWRMTLPSAGGSAPLTVDFGESLDHALALRMFRVLGPDGRDIDGGEALGAEEKTWSFTPPAAWQAGSYKVVVATTLEDLAGNNIGKAFDVDVFNDVHKRIETETVMLPFVVK